jgi:hypothetical protein
MSNNRVGTRRRWGWVVLGGLILLGGLFTGVASHQVTYQAAEKKTLIHYLYDDTTHDAYLELTDTSLYFLNEKDFSPALNSDALQSDMVTLVYDPSNTQSIEADSTNTNASLNGTGSAVVEVISYDTNGQNPKTFTTQEYSQHPNGFYQSNWPLGIGLLIVGLLLISLPFLLFRGNKGAMVAGTPPINGFPPAGQYPAPPNYGQPYQQQPQPQYPGAFYPTPPGANPYGQPAPNPAPGYPMPGAQPPVYPPHPGSEPTRYGPPPQP